MDEVTGEGEKGQQIAALRKELGQEKLCSSFKTPDQLASLVSIAVQQQAARALSDDASVDPAIIYGYLQRVRSRFIEHMKQVSGAASEEDALKRYLPQRLQEVYSESAEQSAAASDPLQAVSHQINDELVMSGVGNGRMTRFVSLQDSIKTNAAVLVLGEAGSGKTTLLLHEASQLAIQARNDSKAWIPIFLPLNTVNNTAHNPLLAQMAHVNDLKPSLLNALWKRRRLCVLLEGGEHLPRHHVPALAEAIGSLHKDNLDGKHRIVVACRTGSSLCKELEKTKPGFHNVVMPSLNSNEIKDFLVRYDVPELARRLNESLHEVAQSPELLAALARSYRDKVWPDVPRNAGQIYSHLINNFLCPDNRGSYDYYHIKRPVLSSLAYMMVRGQDSGMSNNDLCEHVATLLEALHRRHYRHRRVMPSTWNAQELLDELVDSTLLEQRPVDGRYVFGKRGYQDFFAAVHIDAEGLNSIAAQQIIADQQSEHWLPIMINLIGILPQPDMLLKVLCERDASLATQLWFENRPDKVAVPESIVSSFERQEKAAVDSRVMQLIEPYSHAVLKRLLKSADPRQRLQATCALTQHGLPATEALLDAAEDDHPLVQVVAQYALIHLGVGAYPKDPHRPMPPLLNVEDNRFVFNSHGGCNARVGPLRLVDVPNPATVHLSLVMEHLDFDPFEAEVTYKLEHTPPSLLAAYLFEAMKSMDWMCLTVHCRWIARQSAALARKAERRVSLGDLARELALRAARYDCLGKYLVDDLGVPWETVIHDLPTEVKEYVTKNYRKLRRLYNHTNRAHLLELPAPSENSTLTVKSTLEENFGECIAIRAGQVQLQPENGCAQVGDVMLMHMEFAQSVKNNKGGTWTGVEIDTLHGALQQLPLLLRISGAASLEQVTDGSSLNGLLIHNLAGGSCGWTAALSLAVERFTDSSFAGVVVEKYVPEQG